jgi:hypothetical protein
MPFLPRKACLFCPLLAEADLLTNTTYVISMIRWLTEKRNLYELLFSACMVDCSLPNIAL